MPWTLSVDWQSLSTRHLCDDSCKNSQANECIRLGPVVRGSVFLGLWKLRQHPSLCISHISVTHWEFEQLFRWLTMTLHYGESWIHYTVLNSDWELQSVTKSSSVDSLDVQPTALSKVLPRVLLNFCCNFYIDQQNCEAHSEYGIRMETACFIPVSENHKCNAGQEFLLLMLVQRSLRQAKRSSCPELYQVIGIHSL